jgi:serine/threonine protein kinase
VLRARARARALTAKCEKITIMRSVDHPRIVKLYEVYETKNYIVLVLEYIGGGVLLNHITNFTKYSEAFVAKIVRELCGEHSVHNAQHTLHTAHLHAVDSD